MQHESLGTYEQFPDHKVLVLNRNWQAVNIVGVRQGMAVLFQERAQVVYSRGEHFDLMSLEDWIGFSLRHPPLPDEPYLRTVRMDLRIPRILLLGAYDRIPLQEVRFSRENVFIRDHYTCQDRNRRFKASELNLDHVIPRHMGGQTSWENIVTSCVHCNSKKANRLPHEAGMVLRHRPTHPGSRPFLGGFNYDLQQVPDSWSCFLMRKGAQA